MADPIYPTSEKPINPNQTNTPNENPAVGGIGVQPQIANDPQNPPPGSVNESQPPAAQPTPLIAADPPAAPQTVPTPTVVAEPTAPSYFSNQPTAATEPPAPSIETVPLTPATPPSPRVVSPLSSEEMGPPWMRTDPNVRAAQDGMAEAGTPTLSPPVPSEVSTPWQNPMGPPQTNPQVSTEPEEKRGGFPVIIFVILILGIIALIAVYLFIKK